MQKPLSTGFVYRNIFWERSISCTITVWLQCHSQCYEMAILKGSYIEGYFLFRRCYLWLFCWFSEKWVQKGLSRRLVYRGIIFRKLNFREFSIHLRSLKTKYPIVRHFTKGTSVTRSPVMTKTGWLKCQWCGVNPPLDDSPLLGCRGRIC